MIGDAELMTPAVLDESTVDMMFWSLEISGLFVLLPLPLNAVGTLADKAADVGGTSDTELEIEL